ncbi:hypothetical protein F5I97DRAFT_1829152 [Phlebopus sp. FC_14]|nr:hypothetical protein F5I97DRAFT_1829152 [Phlebopus sp. FC_14]
MTSISVFYYSDAELTSHNDNSIKMTLVKMEEIFHQEQKVEYMRVEVEKKHKKRSAIALLLSINHKLILLNSAPDPNYILLEMDPEDQELTEMKEMDWKKEEKELCREEREEPTSEEDDDEMI